jgi:hypothetical protein
MRRLTRTSSDSWPRLRTGQPSAQAVASIFDSARHLAFLGRLDCLAIGGRPERFVLLDGSGCAAAFSESGFRVFPETASSAASAGSDFGVRRPEAALSLRPTAPRGGGLDGRHGGDLRQIGFSPASTMRPSLSTGERHSNASSRPVTGEAGRPFFRHEAVRHPGRIARRAYRAGQPLAHASLLAGLGLLDIGKQQEGAFARLLPAAPLRSICVPR